MVREYPFFFYDGQLRKRILALEDKALRKRLLNCLVILKSEWFNVFNHSPQWYSALKDFNKFLEIRY